VCFPKTYEQNYAVEIISEKQITKKIIISNNYIMFNNSIQIINFNKV